MRNWCRAVESEWGLGETASSCGGTGVRGRRSWETLPQYRQALLRTRVLSCPWQRQRLLLRLLSPEPPPRWSLQATELRQVLLRHPALLPLRSAPRPHPAGRLPVPLSPRASRLEEQQVPDLAPCREGRGTGEWAGERSIRTGRVSQPIPPTRTDCEAVPLIPWFRPRN